MKKYINIARMLSVACLFLSIFAVVVFGMTTPGPGLTEEELLVPLGWSLMSSVFFLLMYVGLSDVDTRQKGRRGGIDRLRNFRRIRKKRP